MIDPFNIAQPTAKETMDVQPTTYARGLSQIIMFTLVEGHSMRTVTLFSPYPADRLPYKSVHTYEFHFHQVHASEMNT